VFVGAVWNGVCYGVWVGLGVRGQANAMTYFRRNFFNLRKSVCVCLGLGQKVYFVKYNTQNVGLKTTHKAFHGLTNDSVFRLLVVQDQEQQAQPSDHSLVHLPQGRILLILIIVVIIIIIARPIPDPLQHHLLRFNAALLLAIRALVVRSR